MMDMQYEFECNMISRIYILSLSLKLRVILNVFHCNMVLVVTLSRCEGQGSSYFPLFYAAILKICWKCFICL